jgi:hypothetical protein
MKAIDGLALTLGARSRRVYWSWETNLELAKRSFRLIDKADKRCKEHFDNLQSMELHAMRGMIAVDDVIASLPRERQKKIAARGNELLEKVQRRMPLSEIRKGRKIRQARMVEALEIGQMQISRLEKRKEPRLSTMQRTIAAMGGHLTMIATFRDQEPVVLVTSQLMEKPAAFLKRSGRRDPCKSHGCSRKIQ